LPLPTPPPAGRRARPAARAPAGGSAWAHLCLVLSLALSALPLLLAERLPLFDYPNHLARIHVLDRWAENPAFRAHFEITSFLIPNALSDAVLLALTPLLGDVLRAGRALLLLTSALTLTGLYLLNRVAVGRFSVWPLFAAVLLYHEMFFWGFLNYLLGLALVPWALAAWLLLDGRRRPLQIGVGALAAIVIFLCHLVAFGLYAAAIAVLELRRAWRRRAEGAGAQAARLAASAAQFLPALALYATISPSRSLPMDLRFDFGAWSKISPFTRLISSGNTAADLIALGAVLGALALALGSGRARLDRGLALVAATFALLVLTLPYSAMGSFFVDSRIAIAAAMFLVAAVGPGRAGGGAGPAALLLLLLVGSRSHVLLEDWRAQSREVETVLAAFREVPPGSLLVPAITVPLEVGEWFTTRRIVPAHEHTAGYAAILGDAIVPNLFAKRGQNPLVYAPALEAMEPLGRNPISRVGTSTELRRLVDEARRVARQRNAVRPPLPGVYIVVFHRRCRDWPRGLPVKAVACGDDFSLMEVAGLDRPASRPLALIEESDR